MEISEIVRNENWGKVLILLLATVKSSGTKTKITGNEKNGKVVGRENLLTFPLF